MGEEQQEICGDLTEIILKECELKLVDIEGSEINAKIFLGQENFLL